MFRRLIKRINIFKRLRVLEEKVEALSKRTVSQLTMGDDESVSTRQIIDEWLNGESEESDVN